MKSTTLERRFLILAAFVAATLVVMATAVSAAAGTRATTGAALPPSGVYTCSWIAANPAAAAQAGVTCDPSGALPPSRSSIAAPDTIDANGCQQVPNGGGRVGKGVWAWSLYEYASSWDFYANWYPTDYTYYIQKTNGVNYTSGEVFDPSERTANVPSNVYRWGAQNHTSTGQSWEVCYIG